MGELLATRRITREEWRVWGTDRRVVEMATRQYGRVATSQLHLAGLDKDGIDRRVRKGLFRREHRGVYVVGHLAGVPWGREAGALLAVGAPVVLSDHSAAARFDLEPRSPAGAVELTVPARRRVERPNLVVHRRDLKAHEITKIDGLPTTTAKRTIEDLAKRVDAWELDRLVGEAHSKKLVDEADLRALTGEAPQITKSEAERMLLKLIKKAGLPRPETNEEIDGWSVDVLWRERRVAVELDSWAWHGRRSRMERDRRKDRALRHADHRLIRVTARQLRDEPEAVVADLAATLARAA